MGGFKFTHSQSVKFGECYPPVMFGGVGGVSEHSIQGEYIKGGGGGNTVDMSAGTGRSSGGWGGET